MKKWMKTYGILACVVAAILIIVLKSNGFLGKAWGGEGAVSGQGTDSYGVDIPYEYRAEISQRNRINAAVDVSDVVRQEGFRKASCRVVDVPKDAVLAMLEDYYHFYEGEEYEELKQYLGKDEAAINFSKEYEELSLFCRLASYIRMAYRDQPLGGDYNKELYALDKDLAHFSLTDCDSRIKELFQAYGVEGELRIQHRTLDHETMEREAVELHVDGPPGKPDYEWDEEDDSYYCEIWQLCNGVPATQAYMLMSVNALDFGEYTILLNKERFLLMFMNEVYLFDYEETREDLMDFEEIIQRYGRITETIPENDSVEITDITLCALNVEQGGGNRAMAPIWVFQGINISGQFGREIPFVVIIDAVTGDELWKS